MVPYTFVCGNYNFTLIDTPGFDDSRLDDGVIVDKILDWLRRAAMQNQKLGGIIYMHNIADDRVRGSARSSRNMFRQLCGPDYFSNVVLATRSWDRVDITWAAARERELYEDDDFWGLLTKKRSSIRRVGYSLQEDLKLLDRIARNKPALLEAQKETEPETDRRRNAPTGAAGFDQQGWTDNFSQRLQERQTINQRILDKGGRS